MFDADVRALLGAIKEDIEKLDPQVRSARDHVIELKTKIVSIHDRLDDLEEKSLDILQALPSIKTKIDTNEVEVLEIRRSRTKIIYWALGLLFVLLGGIAGWVSTVSSIRSEVTHLTVEQNKIRSVLKTHDKSVNLTMKGP